MVNIEKRLEKELGIKLVQVQNVIKLLDEGNTVPFIAKIGRASCRERV